MVDLESGIKTEPLQVHELDEIFGALSDKSRQLILSEIIFQEMSITEISKRCSLSVASTSKHIRVLMRANLITQKPDGRKRICKVYLRNLSKASIWLNSLGLLDLLDLAKFEEFLESEGFI